MNLVLYVQNYFWDVQCPLMNETDLSSCVDYALKAEMV